MRFFSDHRALGGLFARISIVVFLFGKFPQDCVAEASQTLNSRPKSAEQALKHGLKLAELYNWFGATDDFRLAESEFSATGDLRNAFFAHLGLLRATIEKHNLPRTSAELGRELQSKPLLINDKELRLFCLIVKGDIDQEIDTRAARQDWEQLKVLAEALGNQRWVNRALAQIGISAFYDRDLGTASRNVAVAVEAAAKINDVGAQIRFTTVLGMGLMEGKMFEQSLPYFENALRIIKATPDAGYPFFTYEAKVQALIGLKRYEVAQQLVDEMLKQNDLTHRLAPEAETLPLAARIALARGNVQDAISLLQRCIALCKAEGMQRLQTEPETILSSIFRQLGDLERAEYFAAQAAANSQKSGNKWSLPELLQGLAQIQVSRGRYVEADQTYDRASAFIDAGLATSSSVLEKNTLIGASGSLYPEQFALNADQLKNPAKSYTIIEKVRGRITADLLISGSTNSDKAKAIEHTISGLQLKMMSASSGADLNRLRDQIFSAEESRWVTPGISILKRRSQDTVSISSVKRLLDQSTLILEFVVAEPRSYCVVISRSGFRIVPLAGSKKIEALITAYFKAVQNKMLANADARELFNVLFAPIPEAAQKENLVIVRDGQLHLLPFDALQDQSGTYVMQSHTVTYAPSVTSFYLLSQEGRQRGASAQPLLGVGGIPYSQIGLRDVSLIREQSSSAIGDLPNSRQEVLDASSAIAGNNKLLLGAGATETAFKVAASQGFGTIHLAVHGSANSQDPDQAWLALVPDGAAGEDGFLHASEIATMRVRASLVVLSACNTAVGPIQGEEGISTLADSFLLAGAKSVVSTLWSTEDASALFLMQHFYLGLSADEAPALALENAKRQMLLKFGKAVVPYYWAGFTFEGASGAMNAGNRLKN